MTDLCPSPELGVVAKYAVNAASYTTHRRAVLGYLPRLGKSFYQRYMATLL
jgi:hypothetical protein